MKKNYLLVLLFLSVCLSAPVLSGEYDIGVEDIEYYPIYAKRDGIYAGYARELMDEFAKKEGHTFNYKILPVKRLLIHFLNGDIDLKFPDNPNWKQGLKEGKGVIYSDSIVEYVDGVLVKSAAVGIGKKHLKVLGVLRGFTAWDYLDDISAKRIKLNEGDSLKALVKMVEAERINGVYFNVVVAKHFMANTSFEKNKLVFDKSLPYTKGDYYLSTIKHPDLIASFSLFMKNNISLVEALKAKYEVQIFKVSAK